jgi:hypothetical protein
LWVSGAFASQIIHLDAVLWHKAALMDQRAASASTGREGKRQARPIDEQHVRAGQSQNEPARKPIRR